MVVRVAEPGRPAFQLRKGEAGLSLFDPDLVDPPLAESEILEAFRPGCVLVARSAAEVEAKGLQIVRITGAESLPRRLSEAHVEIRPGAGMTRTEFKQALKELE
jgi:hypothetical protein